ncbi:hypothetical protein ABZZ79_08065 [Streptomyces sp. NPDC006458]|uniref:hypothetical protein n=1 Tax=Streptomyces sp. NPDC006458 TaxID=3154302 RepID=UPI0033B59666
MDYDTVVRDLYGLRPEDFTTARDAHAGDARRAGDRPLAQRIGQLRRPSLSAWASNLLVRQEPEQVERLLRLGEGLREAHRTLDGGRLRELSRRQYTLIGALAGQARRLAAQAGHPISEDAQREIENTLRAVLADPEAADQWAAGSLVKPLLPTGHLPTPAPGAARTPAASPARPAQAASRKDPTAGRGSKAEAGPKSGPSHAADQDRKADAERRRDLARARREAEAAADALRGLEEEASRATDEAREAGRRAELLRHRGRELEDELRRVEGEQRQARTAERRAREQAKALAPRVRKARERADAATGEIARLATPNRGPASRRRAGP